MICPGCKQNIQGIPNFCPHCGTKLEVAAQNDNNNIIPPQCPVNYPKIFLTIGIVIAMIIIIAIVLFINMSYNGRWLPSGMTYGGRTMTVDTPVDDVWVEIEDDEATFFSDSREETYEIENGIIEVEGTEVKMKMEGFKLVLYSTESYPLRQIILSRDWTTSHAIKTILLIGIFLILLILLIATLIPTRESKAGLVPPHTPHQFYQVPENLSYTQQTPPDTPSQNYKH